MSNQHAENVDLDQAKWRIRHVQGLLKKHRSRAVARTHAWRAEEVELLDRLSHAHAHFDAVLRNRKWHALGDTVHCSFGFPAF